MAQKMIPPVSGKLADSTIDQMDEDSLMERVRKLMLMKEDLQQAVEKETMEVDEWLQILGCSSCTELEELIPSLSSVSLVTAEQQSLLQDFEKCARKLQAFSQLESVEANWTEEDDILLKFVRPPAKKFSAVLMTLTPSGDDNYSIRHHSLPLMIPLAELEAEYLKNTQGDKSANIKKFVTAVTQYTKALYGRQEQIVIFEEAKMLEHTSIHYNEACTFLNFLAHIKQEDGSNATVFEFVLNYRLLDVFPYNVTVEHITGEPPNADLQTVMEDLANDMKDKRFPEVIFTVFGGQVSEERSSEQESSGSSTLSNEPLLFH